VINYRLNGGYIPLDHWIQTEQGGGRNIGEACHMYDVFRSLAGTPVVSVEATGINPGGKPYLPSDNFSATIAYQDGSIGNLVYTALGPKKGLPKERIEVFCDGEAYIVDDFKQLTKASTGEVLWSAAEVDKGQSAQMNALADSLASGGTAPIAFEEIAETTAVSLYVEDLLFGRVTPND
jgi:predicted dehydrogenase